MEILLLLDPRATPAQRFPEPARTRVEDCLVDEKLSFDLISADQDLDYGRRESVSRLVRGLAEVNVLTAELCRLMCAAVRAAFSTC